MTQIFLTENNVVKIKNFTNKSLNVINFRTLFLSNIVHVCCITEIFKLSINSFTWKVTVTNFLEYYSNKNNIQKSDLSLNKKKL